VAVLDQHTRAIVISVVYDGPPEAGKTTSVRALARSFGREAYTPEERNGRTVYFDWLEHTGGRFNGAPIRFEIVSVPGQRRWTRRRGYFLDRADVVVFVGDTTRPAWPETLSRIDELRARLAARDGTPVGIVLQANKRDRADAVPMAEVRAGAAAGGIALVESVAQDGVGVREAFVFAVRLALDRVREEQLQGRLGVGRTTLGATAEVLELLRGLEEGPTPLAPERPPPGLQLVDDTPPALAPVPPPDGAPRPPSHDVPSGFVWPPIDGRIVLRDAASQCGEARVAPDGGWTAGDDVEWRIYSSGGAAFDSMEEGHRALIAWARLHAGALPLLSTRRCIVLGETGDGAWRLWQMVRREPSLRDLFLNDARHGDAQTVARRLAEVGRLLADAQARCDAAALPLPCTLDTIGVARRDQPVYVALMHHPVPPATARTSAEDVARELASLLRDRPASELAELRAALRGVQPREFGLERGALISELLTGMLAA
jgi:signal recognition particle receptor subunit beta